MDLLLKNQEFQECQSAVLKLVILKYFRNIGPEILTRSYS